MVNLVVLLDSEELKFRTRFSVSVGSLRCCLMAKLVEAEFGLGLATHLRRHHCSD